MPPAGFEPKISDGERTQTYALYRAATGTDIYIYIYLYIYIYIYELQWLLLLYVYRHTSHCSYTCFLRLANNEHYNFNTLLSLQ